MTLSEISIVFPDGTRRAFYHRPDTSDAAMIRQTFQDRCFDLTTLKRWPEIQAWSAAHPEPLIVDAGANIGTSAVWFAMMFPGARVVAIEPEASNYRMLETNTVGLPVGCYQVALTSRPGYARVYHPKGEPAEGCGHAAFRTEPAESGVTAAIMSHLMDVGGGSPFLAKIDIEGAEADVFAGDCSWVDRFPLLIVELHDWLYPGEGLSKPFLWAMQHFNRDFIVRGEHVISIRNPL